MKLLVHENPRTLALVSKSFVLLFRAIGNRPGSHRCAIEFLPREDVDLKSYKVLNDREIHGFVGLIGVEGDMFICCITAARKVAAPVPNESVNKIMGVDFYSLTRSTWDFVELDSNGYPIMPDSETSTPGDYQETSSVGTNTQSYAKHPCHDLKKLLNNGGFYYSSDFDLTRTLQSRGVGSHSLSFDNYNDEYMWNLFMLQEMVDFRDKLEDQMKEKLDDEGFLTVVIRGFAETFQTFMGREKVAMTVISRQSWKRAGTRFNSRGIDDEANVANFVETETILYCQKMCYAYTQIRGSVPVFWEQDTALINPKVQITRSEEASQPIFDKHFERLSNNYGAINIVNLLSTKTSELPLSKRYRSHFERLVNQGTPDLYMTDFDFHRETSDKGFSGANKIFGKIKESLFEFGYFSYDVELHKTTSEQSGVFRTNCLDCLDRTNLVQQFISNFALTIFLKDHDERIAQESDFFSKHNTLWADNGDQISQIYTGTNALKSSFSRSGKMSFAGALSDATKSVSRMYINNFMDKGKQNVIDLLLGRLAGQSPVLLYDPITDYVTEQMAQMKSQFTTNDAINVFTGTYNVNGVNRVEDLSEWLYPIGDKFKPNIVVLGFQEVIELTAGSIINADYSKSNFWTQEVNKCLNQFDKYMMLRAEQMSSLLLLFFVRADSVENVKRVEGSVKKTGLGGMTGNKGAVAIRFNYGASSFCFVNVHLAAGTEKIQERNNDYNTIINGIKFTRGQTINSNETVFWLGDLNYRIGLGNEEVRRRVENEDFDYLTQYDQLTNEIKSRRAFNGFAEPSLNFKPTYKYDKGSNRYDSSEKARTPSWTDRIIYKSSSVKPMAYSSSDSLMFSDHKPVYAAYRAKIEFIDKDKKLKLEKQLYNKYKATHNEDTTISLLDFNEKENLPTPEPVRPSQNKIVETPNFMDDHDDDYKPALPSRRETSYEVLTPSNKPSNSTPPPPPPTPPVRRTVTTSSAATNTAPPPVPPPRSSASTTSLSTTKTTSSPPPVPAARKSAYPPGLDTVLTPKSSGTPTRSNTPLASTPRASSSAPEISKKPTSSSTAPLKPKKPEFLSSSSSPVPMVPKKPASLSSTPTGVSTPSSNGPTIEESSKVPPPPPSRKPDLPKGMDSWKPLVPK